MRRSLLSAAVAALLASAAAAEAPPAGLASPAASDAAKAEALKVRPGDTTLGDADAPVVIVEYASSGCSHCADFHTKTLPELKANYVETGQVLYVFRDFPLDNLAAGASLIARCMPEEKFFGYMDALFRNQATWRTNDDPLGKLTGLAEPFGFGRSDIDACLKDEAKLKAMQAARDEAMNVLGVVSTPTLFVNGEKIEGAASFEEVKAVVDRQLAEAATTPAE